MEKTSIGIDVSKKNFDVCLLSGEKTKFFKYEYNPEQMAVFVKEMKKLKEEGEVAVTMENTGTYHLRLAITLIENNIPVAVVNALKIRRFSQMKMYRTKTDKADAKIIALYGAEQVFEPYKSKDQIMAQIRQIMGTIEGFIKLRVQTENRLEGLNNWPEALQSKSSKGDLIETIDYLNKKISALEKELKELIKNNYPDEANKLKSIPGVGDKVSAAIIGHFGKFEHFQNAKQVISFLGLEPAIRQSGNSINSPAKISKKGSRYLRKLLYMAGKSARKHNPSCKELFDRLEQKGKPYKLSIIAVANKLVRQMFAIIKNETSFDHKYQRT